MSDVGGFEGKILYEVPQPCAPCDSRDTCDTPATKYTPPEGWRVLAVGEVLLEGDVWVNQKGESRPTKRVGERVNDELYIRCDPIEPEPQLEPQPEPQPQPQPDTELQAQVAFLKGREVTLGTRLQQEREVTTRLRSEVSYVQRLLGESRQRVTQLEELVTSLRTINEAQEKSFNAANKANDDLQHRLNVVSAEWAEQAETLREQLDAAAAELQKLHPDHVGRAISTEEWMDQFARDASVSRLQADRNDLAGKVMTLREQLQQANDRLAFLETLQPIAAACHTAQTMVRDMLGHMRCLLALHHTTDRRSFCTLLESILEVFDDAECDEDEDEDTTCTTNTSEAGQG